MRLVVFDCDIVKIPTEKGLMALSQKVHQLRLLIRRLYVKPKYKDKSKAKQAKS